MMKVMGVHYVCVGEHRNATGKNGYYRKAFENPDTFYETIESCDISEYVCCQL